MPDRSFYNSDGTEKFFCPRSTSGKRRQQSHRSKDPSKKIHSAEESGYTVKQKNCMFESCSDCPHRDECFKGWYENRKIRISQTMAKQKERADRLMFSDDCIILLMNRSIQVGDALGVQKEGYAFRRFLTGGKSKTEIQFYCSALPLRFKSIATD